MVIVFRRKVVKGTGFSNSGFTKLNNFDQRYRDNGFQIPGQLPAVLSPDFSNLLLPGIVLDTE